MRRSPSPEPLYSTDGKRLNTRETRVRKRLEDERHELVQEMKTLNKEYNPPVDYKYVCVHNMYVSLRCTNMCVVAVSNCILIGM